jgi:hypothetical protein
MKPTEDLQLRPETKPRFWPPAPPPTRHAPPYRLAFVVLAAQFGHGEVVGARAGSAPVAVVRAVRASLRKLPQPLDPSRAGLPFAC